MTREKMIEALARAIYCAQGSGRLPAPWTCAGDVHEKDWAFLRKEYEKSAAAVLEMVKPKPLVWDYVSNTHTWQAQSPYGEYSVGFDDVWWGQLIGNMTWEWEPDCDPRTYDGPEAAQAAAQDHADAAHCGNTALGDIISGKP